MCSFMFTKKIAFWLHTIFFFAKRRTTAIGNIDFCLIFFLNLEKNPPFFERSDDVLGWMF